VEQLPTLLVNDEKLQDLTNAANTINNFFITIIEKLNIKQTERGDDVSTLKDSFTGNFASIKIILINEGQTKSIIKSLIQNKKKSSGYEEITSKILKSCVPLNHPLSYIYNHSLYIYIYIYIYNIKVFFLAVLKLQPFYKEGERTILFLCSYCAF
jgi:hypothetical protein